MAKEKLRLFEVKEKINKSLTWVLVAYLVLEALVEIGDFIGLARVSSGPIVYGLSRITQSGVGHTLLFIAVTGCLVYIWEWFRRSLKASGSLIWYIVLALITLMVCDVPFSFVPDNNLLQPLQSPSHWESFASSFRYASSGVQSILQIVLSFALLIKFRGRISMYAGVNLLCILMTGVGTGWLYTFLVNSGMNSLTSGLAAAFVLLRYVLIVLPVVFLRRSMTYRNVHDADSSTDLGSTEHV